MKWFEVSVQITWWFRNCTEFSGFLYWNTFFTHRVIVYGINVITYWTILNIILNARIKNVNVKTGFPINFICRKYLGLTIGPFIGYNMASFLLSVVLEWSLLKLKFCIFDHELLHFMRLGSVLLVDSLLFFLRFFNSFERINLECMRIWNWIFFILKSA